VKRAAVRISTEALASVLHLRAGIRVTGAKHDRSMACVTFYLEGADLPEHGKLDEARRFPLHELMDWEL
jgi:hypothetical protein